LDDGRRDGRPVDVAKALRGKDDGGVLLSERLQPFAELAGKAVVVERQPALVDDDEGRRPVEAVLDAMEEIGEHRRRRTGADEALGLESLHARFAEMLDLRVEQPPIGATHAKGPERLFEIIGLEQYGQTGD